VKSKKRIAVFAGLTVLFFVLTSVLSYRRTDYKWSDESTFSIYALKHDAGFPWICVQTVNWQTTGDVSPDMYIPGYVPGTRVSPPNLISDVVIAAAAAAAILLLYKTLIVRLLPRNAARLWWRMLIVAGWGVALVALALVLDMVFQWTKLELPLWSRFVAAAILLFVLIPSVVAATLLRFGSYFLTVSGILLVWLTAFWLLLSCATISIGKISLPSWDELPTAIGVWLFLVLLSSIPVIALTMIRRWRMDKEKGGGHNRVRPALALRSSDGQARQRGQAGRQGLTLTTTTENIEQGTPNNE